MNSTRDDDSKRARSLQSGLRGQREIYQSLVAISGRQAQVLSDGATEEILQLARTKQTEMGRIETIELDLAPLKRDWPVLRERVGAALRVEIEEELAAIQTVLQRLIELETRGGSGLGALRRETAEKLRQVEGGRRIQQAYVRGQQPGSARYLDRME